MDEYTEIYEALYKGALIIGAVLGLCVGVVVGGGCIICCAAVCYGKYVHVKISTNTDHVAAAASTNVELVEITPEEVDLQGNAFTTVEV